MDRSGLRRRRALTRPWRGHRHASRHVRPPARRSIPINARLEQRARRFKRPVLLLQGDTHVYKTDRPLAGAPNLVRVVVEGETASEWLRLTVDPRTRDVFTWKRMPLPPQLTVASFNIHHGAGTDDRLDLERVAAEIKPTGARVFVSREIRRRPTDQRGTPTTSSGSIRPLLAAR